MSAAAPALVCETCDAEAARVDTGALADLRLPPELSAAVPAPRRDAVRLLVGRRSGGEVTHHGFRELPGLLRAGDVLVVNTSRTLPAALDGWAADPGTGGTAGARAASKAGPPVVVHFSTRRDDGRWVVEVRSPDGHGSTVRRPGGPAGTEVRLAGGGRLVLERPLDPATDRLWVASVRVPDVVRHLRRHGRPIRYAYTARDQPLSAYQTVFGTPSADGRGSAEMPSAARPFTASLVTELVSRGVQIAPIELHTGVASAEAHEPPYAEPYTVPASTAWQVNAARAAGGRVVAVGTTAVRALESAADGRGVVRAAHGWTELVITPERGVRAVDGLLTGLHEPEASHLLMLRALSGDGLLTRVYAEALRGRYLWHEFGDVNLLLP
ncbi:S-adenosylmethionine:tRNA ribosyltransferase-isomerase [Streptomyces sp. NBC_00669]|uniref:S-adenosylmethionine:tRNA ribosyltransferase-isomerase n=1 Tax=Streptomyces sp. NBC_00669 TaxID=2976011 RepID=UPI002E32DB54|nr:S-adenosylmethionine:tRNA ribosyltransferase-isomerase [Streptomyces sp. NBC_00669]